MPVRSQDQIFFRRSLATARLDPSNLRGVQFQSRKRDAASWVIVKFPAPSVGVPPPQVSDSNFLLMAGFLMVAGRRFC